MGIAIFFHIDQFADISPGIYSALFGKDPVEIADADVTAFDALKKDVLGKQLIMSGRVNKNTMMDRLEFMASNVKEVDPVEMVKAYE